MDFSTENKKNALYFQKEMFKKETYVEHINRVCSTMNTQNGSLAKETLNIFSIHLWKKKKKTVLNDI